MGEFRSLLLVYGVYLVLDILFLVLVMRSKVTHRRNAFLFLGFAGLLWLMGDASLQALIRFRDFPDFWATHLIRFSFSIPFLAATIVTYARMPVLSRRHLLVRGQFRNIAAPALVLGISTSWVLFLLNLRDFVFLGSVIAVLPVTVIGYMMTMFRFWNFSRILSRIVLYYGICLVASAGLYGALRLGDAPGNETPPFYFYLIFLLTSVVVTMAAFLHNQYLRVTLQFAFFRDVYRKEKALNLFINEMPSSRGTDHEILDNLLEVMLQNLYEVFRFDTGFILTADGNRGRRIKYFGPPSDGRESRLVDKLLPLLRRRLPEEVLAEFDRVFPLEEGYSPEFTDDGRRIVGLLRDNMMAFQERGYVVFLPLVLRDEIWGFVVLGEKTNGRPYYSGEFKLLENARPSFALALRNNAVVEELRHPEIAPGMSVPDPTQQPPQPVTIAMKERMLIYAGEPMHSLVEKTTRIAASSLPVLIRGETGTGKELIARLLYRDGPGADAPFVPVNCAAIPATLWESEIFGHKQGAFTGATTSRPGLVEQARGGILFLDEIGEMPLDMQPKILRLIQERTYQPVGGRKIQQADCRLVFATHRDLPEMVREGTFREDLYYRINVHSLLIPPLRERTGDIPHLVAHVLRTHQEEMKISAAEVPSETMEILIRYHWPGNIRELENCLMRSLTESDSLLPASLPPEIRKYRSTASAAKRNRPDARAAYDYERLMEGYEREVLARALQACEGNRTHAAKMLSISRGKLIYRIRELGIRE